MSTLDRVPRLLGRRSECEALDRLLASVRAGQSRVLVLRGEAGVGKTALLEYLSQRASGCGIARAAGVESEMELAFAGLHQLCAPLLDRLERLPGPQRDALGTAFGLRAGRRPGSLPGRARGAEPAGPRWPRSDRWSASSTTRSGSIGASAQALAFVARRLLAESVALVFAVREPAASGDFDGLPELAVGGLDDA